MDENINLTILNEIGKATRMGLSSITFVSEKVEDETMKQDLSTQYAEYGKILDKVNTQFEKYGEIPDEEPLMDKMMSWTGVQMNTLKDSSNSHIAELMIQGNLMGIIECQKLLNHSPEMEPVIKDILNEFIMIQNNHIEKMKTYL
ncbi:MAG: hypothetical protein HFJ44_08500 [Clostridia bacterium]|nr:hypothetical protein [Clostridia bacterium]